MGKGLAQIVLDRLPSRDEIAHELWTVDVVRYGAVSKPWRKMTEDEKDRAYEMAEAVLALIRDRIEEEA